MMNSKFVCGIVSVCLVPVLVAGSLTDKIAQSYKVKATDTWYGAQRTVFDFKGYDAWVVEPPVGVKPAPGNHWTWTMQWRDAFVKRTTVPRLLAKGWYHVAIDTFKHRMDEEGLRISAEFQAFLVKELGFAPKACLIGMSWGGFFSTRYVNAYPDNVAKIYYDAPLMSFKSFGPERVDRIGPWANQKPSNGDWSQDPRMPVSMAPALAKRGTPLLLLYGGVDTTCPPVDNCLLFMQRYKAAGGTNLTCVRRGLYGHHPHGVEVDEDTIINFFMK